ncbi:conserved protein of unknown function [Georgfuchsia toluolica]|uniref:Uncharacterized protein n=2 Tax=Georgfuchsia toluolica TaxID=424218 RepID=A0A916J979_9PROT|nr:conserved protein of unknown function [Georgfuchsia toluolica]
MLYDDERRLGVAFLKGLIGEQGFDEFNQETAKLTHDEQNQMLADMVDDEAGEEFADLLELPETEDEWLAAEKALAALPPEEQAVLIQQGTLFWAGIFGTLFNTLSLMVHGIKLTTLVPLALNGDDDALLKAAQIDRCLITHHPYFLARKQQAQDLGQDKFLQALAYRECNPPLRGKIRYPALYMLFGILDSVRWLHDLKHEEILDLCDSAGLERYQNRIDDVNYLTKRLLEYSRWQKSGGLSMH